MPMYNLRYCDGHIWIFNNLSGRNFSGSRYRDYLAAVSQQFGVSAGTIEHYRDGVLVETATIPEF